jgi:hypothetical protein
LSGQKLINLVKGWRSQYPAAVANDQGRHRIAKTERHQRCPILLDAVQKTNIERVASANADFGLDGKSGSIYPRHGTSEGGAGRAPLDDNTPGAGIEKNAGGCFPIYLPGQGNQFVLIANEKIQDRKQGANFRHCYRVTKDWANVQRRSDPVPVGSLQYLGKAFGPHLGHQVKTRTQQNPGLCKKPSRNLARVDQGS